MSQMIKETYTQPVLTKHERLVDITATASHGRKNPRPKRDRRNRRRKNA